MGEKKESDQAPAGKPPSEKGTESLSLGISGKPLPPKGAESPPFVPECDEMDVSSDVDVQVSVLPPVQSPIHQSGLSKSNRPKCRQGPYRGVPRTVTPFFRLLHPPELSLAWKVVTPVTALPACN